MKKYHKPHKQIIKNDISRAWEFLYCLHYIRKFHDVFLSITLDISILCLSLKKVSQLI